MVTDRDLSRILRRLGACDEAREWADGKDLVTAWTTCNRSDWMVWLLDALGYRDDRTLRLYACWCVKQEPCWSLLSDERSRTAVEVAERYARGEATDEELAAARDAARDAWYAAEVAAEAAWAAARAAAWAAQADRLREVVPIAVVQRLVDCYANRAKGATRGTLTTYVLREGPEVRG